MPLVKDNSIITDGFSVYPYNSYIRVAKVEQVSLFSKDMIVQFLDGGKDDQGEFLEDPITVQCIVGSDEPSTTYAPSCTVYGKGDLANILILETGDSYAISLADLYKDVNRENFALIQGWALYDVLPGVLVDGLDDGENSYLTFWQLHGGPVYSWTTVTTITGDPTKRHVMRRMLDYFLSEQTHNMSVTTTDWGGWSWDTSRSGPDNNPQRQFYGRKHKGKRINGFPYVEDVDFTNDAATLENNIIAYHPTLEGMKTGNIHPVFNDTLYSIVRRYFEHATVVWWNDEEPTHVVLIAAYPAWDTVQNIHFIEVPVYSMTGRKFLERPIIDEDLVTEHKGEIDKSWQFYGDQIRVLHSIDRSQYIDFLVHDDDLSYSERLTKAAVAYLPTQPDSDTKDFGILDGYGWTQGGSMFGVNKVKKIQGTIERTLKPLESDGSRVPYQNGSLYDYAITHNNPATTGNLDLSYDIRFEYEWNNGFEWERQTPVNSAKEFNCYTDGVNSMERTIDFSYYCDGHYKGETTYGRVLWNDNEPDDTLLDVQLFDNEFWHRVYRNGGHVWTDYWRFYKTAAFTMGGDSTQYLLFYADVEYDLFVMLKIVTHIAPHNSPGPGWTFLDPIGTHRQTHYGVVIFQGTEWTLWKYEIYLEKFISIWNLHPWIADSSIPIWPGFPTNPIPDYSIDTNYACYFMYQPTFDPWQGTLKPGYTTIGFGTPAPYFGPEGIQTWQVVKTDDYAQPDDLLQVSIDYENDSFCVIWESFYQDDIANYKYLSIPNGKALYRFDGGMPHFNPPTVTHTIEL